MWLQFWSITFTETTAPQNVAWVSGVSGGKGERWKRKRERAEGDSPDTDAFTGAFHPHTAWFDTIQSKSHPVIGLSASPVKKLRQGREVCNWYQLAIHSFEGAQKFEKSTVFILHFTPACVLLSVCSLHCTLSLHFTPGLQSAVCSPQSAFYTDRFLNCEGWAQHRSLQKSYIFKAVPMEQWLIFRYGL